MVDQCNQRGGAPEGFSVVKSEGIFEERMLPDGRTFRMVKVFYHPRLLAGRARQLGFEVTAERVDNLFYLSGTRSAS